MYAYDRRLFKKLLLGEEGVGSLHLHQGVLYLAVLAYYLGAARFLGPQHWQCVVSGPSLPGSERLISLKCPHVSIVHSGGLPCAPLTEDADLSHTIPLVVHGDDAECHRRRSFMVVTWGSCVVHATPFDSKFVCYVGDNSQCGEECYSVLDMWVAWSLIELMLGHWLDVDPWGRPFNRYFSALACSCVSSSCPTTALGILTACHLCLRREERQNRRELARGSRFPQRR